MLSVKAVEDDDDEWLRAVNGRGRAILLSRARVKAVEAAYQALARPPVLAGRNPLAGAHADPWARRQRPQAHPFRYGDRVFQ